MIEQAEISNTLRELKVGEKTQFPMQITFSVRSLIHRMGVKEDILFKTKLHRSEGYVEVERTK